MIKIIAQEVAEIVGCSHQTVARVLNGERNPDTPLGREIMRINKLLQANADRQTDEENQFKADIKATVPKIKKLR